MLWVQYEANQTVDPLVIKDRVSSIAKHVAPYHVVAFDYGPFGVGLFVSEDFDSGSDSDISDVSMDSYQWADISNSNGKGPTGVEIMTLNDGSQSNTQNFNGDNGTHQSQTNDPTQHNDKNRENAKRDPKDSNGDKHDDQNHGPPSPTNPKNPITEENNRFTGTATLDAEDSLKQTITISFGLSVRPLVGRDYADCKIKLDPVTIRTSKLYSHSRSTSEYLFVTEQANLLVGVCGGECDPPVSIHPLEQHFAGPRTVSTRSQYDASLEISSNPNLTLKASKGGGNTVQYDPITLSLRPLLIGPGGGNDHEWQYQPLGAYGKHLELSSENPPVHRATYRVLSTEPPEAIKIVVEGIFRKNRRVGKRNSRLPIRFRNQILQNLQSMHIISTLEVKIGNEKHDWFAFPGEKKKGHRLEAKVKLSDGKLKFKNPDKKDVESVTVSLNTGVFNN